MVVTAFAILAMFTKLGDSLTILQTKQPPDKHARLTKTLPMSICQYDCWLKLWLKERFASTLTYINCTGQKQNKGRVF